MKSYKGLTLRYLKVQKKRSLLTISGVILSIALATSIGLMFEGLQKKVLDDTIRDYGDYYTMFSGVSEEKAAALRGNAKLEKAGLRTEGGVARISEHAFVSLNGTEKAYWDMMSISVLEGRLPEKPDEIALEKWVLDEMPVKPAIGDAVRLTVEDRSEASAAEEFYGGKKPAEGSVRKAEKSFTLCGVVKSSPWTQLKSVGRAFVTLAAVREIKGGPLFYEVYIKTKDKLPIQKTIGEIRQGLDIPAQAVSDNARILNVLGQSANEEMNGQLATIVGFLVTLIIIASAAVIYNSFHISVLERIRQFGLLRSVGATPAQIRIIVFGEALVITLVSLPLGLLGGYLAVWTVLFLLNLGSFSVLQGVEPVVTARTLIAGSAVGIAAVFLSALSPAITAARVSPIQAVMNTAKRESVRKKGRKHTLLRKLAGMEAVMALKNLKRNKKRFYITVFSMCIGIVVYIVFNTFANYAFQGLYSRDGFMLDYRISGGVPEEGQAYSARDYEDLLAVRGVKKVYKRMHDDVLVTFGAGSLSNAYRKKLSSGLGAKPLNLEDSGDFRPLWTSDLWGYDSLQLKDATGCLINGNVDEAAMNREQGALIVQNIEIKGDAAGRRDLIKASDLKVGDYITIDPGEELSKSDGRPAGLPKLKVMGILDRVPFDAPYPQGAIAVITTEQVYKSLTGTEGYQGFDVAIEKDADRKAIRDGLMRISGRVRNGMTADMVELAAVRKNARLTVSVLLYGFVAVIALIGVLNIINTISTNLILRTREFGTLRAAGMTMPQMKRMIAAEGLLYGLIGTFWGSLWGTLLAYCVYRLTNDIRSMLWVPPFGAILTAGTATVLVTLLSTLVPLKRVSEMNIIEAIGIEE